MTQENAAQALVPFTVVGFWYEDEPVTVAVFAGELTVLSDGNLQDGGGFQGAWSDTVRASSVPHAEIIAVANMYETLERKNDGEKQQAR